MQFFTDKTRESDPHALPDAESFLLTDEDRVLCDYDDPYILWLAGWYWQSCFPGCLPDGDPIGPFETESAAIESARSELMLPTQESIDFDNMFTTKDEN